MLSNHTFQSQAIQAFSKTNTFGARNSTSSSTALGVNSKMVPSISLEDATRYYPAALGNSTEPVSLMFLTLNQMKIHQNEKSTHAGD